jgi:hypothetical protein
MRCRSRTFTGAAIVAVAVTAVLALSGCDDGGKQAVSADVTTSGRRPGAEPSPSGAGATATPTRTPTPTTTADPKRSVEGVWLAMQGSTKVQLVLGKGKAGLTSTHLCGGAYTDGDGLRLVLTCMDGDKERTSGHGVLASDGKTLTVEWTDGPTDTFTRTGLPSS